jgi:hypothetical protein
MTHFVLGTFSGYNNDFPVNNQPGTVNSWLNNEPVKHGWYSKKRV